MSSQIVKTFILKIIPLFFYLLGLISISISLFGYGGKFNLYLEAITNFKPQLLLLSVICLPYFYLRKQYIWLGLISIVLFVNASLVIPWYVNFSTIDTTNTAKYNHLKILSFNVLTTNKQYQETIDFTLQENPDIAVFLEAKSPSWNQGLQSLENHYQYHVSYPKLQIEIYSQIALTNPQVDVYGGYRGVITNQIYFEEQEQPITFIATHAYPQIYYGSEGFKIRNNHLLQGIGKHVSGVKTPVIVIGDLNATMWSPFYQEMIKLSGLKNTRQGWGILPTQSSFNPNIKLLSTPIDHCLISPKIVVEKMKTASNFGSDHLPIVVDLAIPKA